MMSYGLIPKLKILIALYQMVVSIPQVYDVDLPQEYYEVRRHRPEIAPRCLGFSPL